MWISNGKSQYSIPRPRTENIWCANNHTSKCYARYTRRLLCRGNNNNGGAKRVSFMKRSRSLLILSLGLKNAVHELTGKYGPDKDCIWAHASGRKLMSTTAKDWRNHSLKSNFFSMLLKPIIQRLQMTPKISPLKRRIGRTNILANPRAPLARMTGNFCLKLPQKWWIHAL